MCPVFRSLSLFLTQVTQPAFFFLSYSSSYELSLRWLVGLEAPGGWLFYEPPWLPFVCSCCILNSLFMGILHNHYLGCLRLLKSSDLKKNPRPRATHRSCRVVYSNIRGLHKNLSDLCLAVRGGDMVFVPILWSLPDAIFPVQSFGRPMQLFRSEVDRFRGLLYTCVKTVRHMDTAVMSMVVLVIVVRICSSGYNFYVFGVYRNPDLSDKIIFWLFVDGYG